MSQLIEKAHSINLDSCGLTYIIQNMLNFCYDSSIFCAFVSLEKKVKTIY